MSDPCRSALDPGADDLATVNLEQNQSTQIEIQTHSTQTHIKMIRLVFHVNKTKYKLQDISLICTTHCRVWKTGILSIYF